MEVVILFIQEMISQMTTHFTRRLTYIVYLRQYTKNRNVKLLPSTYLQYAYITLKNIFLKLFVLDSIELSIIKQYP